MISRKMVERVRESPDFLNIRRPCVFHGFPGRLETGRPERFVIKVQENPPRILLILSISFEKKVSGIPGNH